MEESEETMKKRVVDENYLDKIPKISQTISYKEENDLVVIMIENKGVFNKIAQKLLKKPKISYVHLDEFGSFVFGQIDGKKTITDIGVLVSEKFGEKANPLYERLAKYFMILESYRFITFA